MYLQSGRKTGPGGGGWRERGKGKKREGFEQREYVLPVSLNKHSVILRLNIIETAQLRERHRATAGTDATTTPGVARYPSVTNRSLLDRSLNSNL